ncbi:MAG: phosphomannomutase/phosphoglucomutase [Pseudomonadota bacterium]
MVKIPNALPTNNLPIKSILFGLIVLAAAIALGFFALDYLEAKKARELEAEQLRLQAKADEIALRIATTITPLRTTLRELTRDPAVVAALPEDEDARKAKASEFAAKIDSALLLRILRDGDTHSSRSESPPLTFASIEMLKSAKTSDKLIPVEIHLGGTANEHLVMIERIVNEEELVGFLHLSISAELIRKAIQQQKLEDGYLEVRQRATNGPPVVIGRQGQPPTEQQISLVANVPGTAFLASYRFGKMAGPGFQLGGLVVPGLGALALVLIAWVLGKKLRPSASSGPIEVEYAGAIKAVLDGTHPGLDELLPGGSGKFPTQGTASQTPDTAEPMPSGLDIDFDLAENDNESEEEQTIVDRGPQDHGIEISETTTEEMATLVPNSIFRSYDIRGVVGESLTSDGVYQIGRALGTEAKQAGEQTVLVARDGRNSSPELRDGLVEGLRDSGCDVLDVGLVPTPILYFATHYLDSHSGVMVTGSHNPPEYNGLKVVLDGKTLCGDAIQAIRERVESQEYASGEGSIQTMEIIPDYIRRVGEEVPVTFDALKVVVDCANSAPGIVAPHILRAIGHDVVELYCDVDGNFPNHHPDPSQPQNLRDLIEAVDQEDADIGIAFDGDGDRIGVVDNAGNIIWPDKQLMLFARDVLKNNAGAKVIYDVKCSTALPKDVTDHGGEAIMSKTGHSIIKAKMEETGALLAGDLSGHIFFKDRWYGFDDALYAAARLLEILVEADRSPAEVFAELPGGFATPELLFPMAEDQHAGFMEKVIAAAKFDGAELNDLDGLRVDFPNAWGLIRPSNTTPAIMLRFEGDDESALTGIKDKFKAFLTKIDSNTEWNF